MTVATCLKLIISRTSEDSSSSLAASSITGWFPPGDAPPSGPGSVEESRLAGTRDHCLAIQPSCSADLVMSLLTIFPPQKSMKRVFPTFSLFAPQHRAVPSLEPREVTPLRAQMSPGDRAQQSCSQDPPTHSTARAQAAHRSPPGSWEEGTPAWERTLDAKMSVSLASVVAVGLVLMFKDFAMKTPPSPPLAQRMCMGPSPGAFSLIGAVSVVGVCVVDVTTFRSASITVTNNKSLCSLKPAPGMGEGEGGGQDLMQPFGRCPYPQPLESVRSGEPSFGAQCPVLCGEKGQNARMGLPIL